MHPAHSSHIDSELGSSHGELAESSRTPRLRTLAIALLVLGLLEGSRLFVTYGTLGRGISLVDALGTGLMDAGSWLPLLPVGLWALRRFPWPQPSAWGCGAIHVTIGIALAAAQGALFAGVTTLVRELRFGEGDLTRELESALRFKLQANLLLYAVVVFAAQALRAQQRARREERRRSELDRLLAETRFAALQSRLQPHFLFNTLNIATGLIPRDPERAERVLVKLADLLRAVLHLSERSSIDLREEVELLETYLDIQRIRFGDRLLVRVEIAPEALDLQVPPLLLQPLAENAIQHGLSARAAGTLTLEGHRVGDRLHLELEDDGQGLGTDRNGVGLGLANTRARLATMGEDVQLELEERPSGGVRVKIDLPARRCGASPA